MCPQTRPEPAHGAPVRARATPAMAKLPEKERPVMHLSGLPEGKCRADANADAHTDTATDANACTRTHTRAHTHTHTHGHAEPFSGFL